jgi:hypothetical protein
MPTPMYRSAWVAAPPSGSRLWRAAAWRPRSSPPGARRLNHNPFNLIEADFIAPAVVELRRAG